MTDQPDRRTDDRRIDRLDDKVSRIGKDVITIRELLLANRVDTLDKRLEAIEDWRTRWQGSWMLVTGVAVVLGIIATFFAVVKPLIDVVPR